MANAVDIPSRDRYLDPILRSLKELGGSATLRELRDRVASAMALTEKQLSVPHDPSRSKVEYQIAWALTCLKKAGLIHNSDRGVWSITSTGQAIESIDAREILKYGAKNRPAATETRQPPPAAEEESEVQVEGAEWRSELVQVLQGIPPAAFERLCQRLLRESGFVEVEVTGRSGDGGIDGVGVLRVKLVSFRVFFQCKRWQGSIGAKEIRDFRGAMAGRTDKGLFITTGSYSRQAQTEARREGAPVIDLIDGEQLPDLLKELGLGIKAEMVETITIDRDWFANV